METVKWTSLKDMKDKRVFSSLVARGEDFLYVIGGCDISGQPIDTVECYNKKNGRWKCMASMETKRAAPSSQLVNDHIVSVGGVSCLQKPLDIVESYSLVSKTWTQCHPIGEPLLGIGSFVYKGDMYIVGGMRSDTTPTAAFLRYDQPADQWSSLPNMPTARYATYQFLVNNKLYVIGGRVGKLAVSSFEMYDFDVGAWTKMADVPSKRIFAAYTATKDFIYSVGGLADNTVDGFTNCCQAFHLETETWKTCKDMLCKRGDFVCSSLRNNRIIVTGGLGNQGKPLTDSEIYDPVSDEWTVCPRPPQGHASASYHVNTTTAATAAPPSGGGGELVADSVYIVGGLSDRGPSAGFKLMQLC